MAAFRLSVLEPHLLEKVIQKLDFKSYYRLQRACSEMMDFIHTTSNIKLSVWASQKYSLTYSRTSCSWKCTTYKNERNYDVKGIFGLRVGTLKIISEEWEEIFLNRPDRFVALCAFLKKHQITCTTLSVHPDSGITDDQYRTLLGIVKPEAIEMDGEKYTMYDVLLQPKSEIMDKVELYNMDPNDVLGIVKRFLPAFPEFEIHTHYTFDEPEDLQLIPPILEVLMQPLPDLREFVFSFKTGDAYVNPLDNDVMDQFLSNYKRTEIRADENGDVSVEIELPQHFPKGSICRFYKDSINYVYISVTIAGRGKSKRQLTERSW